jgi:hypothetical protein
MRYSKLTFGVRTSRTLENVLDNAVELVRKIFQSPLKGLSEISRENPEGFGVEDPVAGLSFDDAGDLDQELIEFQK